MSGIVTIEDILEEIVGEIEDEYDQAKEAESPLVRTSETESLVMAMIHIDDLNDSLNLDIPRDNGYDTLGGFLFFKMGRIPEVGETCEYENLRFEILEADPRRIRRVKVVVGE